MARKKDAEEDQASKAILEQLQTKTVGAPPSSTGLTGDQLPNTIFSADDFELIKNQITLQLSNVEVLNLLNTIGQITNKQSSSGPIEVRYVGLNITGANDDPTIFFQPNLGEIWQLNWGQWQGDGTSNLFYQGINSSGDRPPGVSNGGVIFFSSATNGKFCTDNSAEIAGGARIFVSHDTPLLVQTYNDTNGADWAAWFTRMR